MRRMWLVLAVAACGSTPPPKCITIAASCDALYVPTFDNVYKMTLNKSCGNTNSGCHSAAANMDGLSFETEDVAYMKLVGQPSGRDHTQIRVDPGNPACSVFIVRTDSPGTDYQMPQGDPLSPEERCALIQWVQNGAKAGSAM